MRTHFFSSPERLALPSCHERTLLTRSCSCPACVRQVGNGLVDAVAPANFPDSRTRDSRVKAAADTRLPPALVALSPSLPSPLRSLSPLSFPLYEQPIAASAIHATTYETMLHLFCRRQSVENGEGSKRGASNHATRATSTRGGGGASGNETKRKRKEKRSCNHIPLLIKNVNKASARWASASQRGERNASAFANERCVCLAAHTMRSSSVAYASVC